MPANRISLASGVVPEFGPLETISAAASGGFDAVGLWIEPPAWTPQLLQDAKACLSGSGLELLDVEVVWLKPGPSDPAHFRCLDIASGPSARYSAQHRAAVACAARGLARPRGTRP
jgi:hypothetical protein